MVFLFYTFMLVLFGLLFVYLLMELFIYTIIIPTVGMGNNNVIMVTATEQDGSFVVFEWMTKVLASEWMSDGTSEWLNEW